MDLQGVGCTCEPDSCKRGARYVSDSRHSLIVDKETVTYYHLEEEATPVITPDDSVLDFSKILGPENKPIGEFKEQLVFRENLVISQICRDPYSQNVTSLTVTNTELKPVGGISVDVQLAGPENNNFLVFASSQLTYKNQNGGSNITSWLLPNLQTIEERRIEFINTGVNSTQCVDKRQIFIGLQGDFYHVMCRSKLETSACTSYYPNTQTRKLICEGANFILMRYLALTRFIGTFEMSTVYLNGDLCRNVYFGDGPESAMINNSRCDVIRIQRIIKEKCGIVHNCITTLLLDGHIVRQEWENCCYVLHLNPLIKIPEQIDSFKTPLFSEWEKDLQLYSNFQDIDVLSFYMQILEKVLISYTVLIWYTDGLRTHEETGAGVHGVRPRKDLVFALGQYASVFQSEVYATLQCLSYLDFKTKRLAIHKNYYAEHPELRTLISDYCQNILIRKPKQVLDFTTEYFQGFSEATVPYNVYLNRNEDVDDIM